MMKTDIVDKYVTYGIFGSVTSYSGLIVKCSGLRVPLGSMCNIFTSGGIKRAEVIAVGVSEIELMCIDEPYGLKVGDQVEVVSTFQYIPVSKGLLGRIVDSFGKSIDGCEELPVEDYYQLFNEASNPLNRKVICEPLPTGVRSIDSFITCAKGQRIGIFSGSGVGKSILLGMITRYTAADVVVVCLVGERGREVKEFMQNSLGEEGMKKSVVIVETSDKPAVCRYRAPFAATAIAEYFRDQGKDVLLLMDSITRMANAKREIGLSLGEPPTTKGYTPTVFSDMPKLLERAGCFEKGTITGIYTVLVEQDDVNDPIADHVRSIIDGHIWLSRDLANRGIYPACDILQSISRLMVNVVEERHYNASRDLVRAFAVYKDNEDFISLGAYKQGSNKEIDAAIKLKDRLTDFVVQGINESSDFSETNEKLIELAKYYRELVNGRTEE